MFYFLFFVFWMIGLMVTSFTIIPILIILNFGIPITKKLEKLKAIKKENGIIKRYSITILFLGTIFLGMLLITNNFFPNYIYGILFGGGMALFFGIGKTGQNPENFSDYIQTNSKYLLVDSSTIMLTLKTMTKRND